MIKKFIDYIKEEMDGAAGGASTVSAPGSGTAVGGGATGTFVSSSGVSVSGGDSGSAFSTNSNSTGMGPIVSAQPSSTPGDVKGSTKGSGDIGSAGGVYSKVRPTKKKKKKKTKTKNNKAAQKIDNLYVTKYTESNSGGKIIANWDTFSNESFWKFGKKNKSVEPSEVEPPIVQPEVQEEVQEEVYLKLVGVNLEEKGNFGQGLIDIYLMTIDSIYKLGQYRFFESLADKDGIFYPEFREIESGRLRPVNKGEISGAYALPENIYNIVIKQLKQDNKLGGLMDDIITYYDIVKNIK